MNPKSLCVLHYFLLAFFLVLCLYLCNICPFFSNDSSSYLYFFHKKFYIFIDPLHNSSCTLEDCQCKQLEQTCFRNRVHRAESFECLTLGCSDTLCPYFLCEDTLHTHAVCAACAVISISCVIDNRHAQDPTQGQNTGCTQWIYSHFFWMLKVFFKKRTICLLTKQNNLTLHLKKKSCDWRRLS